LDKWHQIELLRIDEFTEPMNRDSGLFVMIEDSQDAQRPVLTIIADGHGVAPGQHDVFLLLRGCTGGAQTP
jgi:hypothetical protein